MSPPPHRLQRIHLSSVHPTQQRPQRHMQSTPTSSRRRRARGRDQGLVDPGPGAVVPALVYYEGDVFPVAHEGHASAQTYA